MTFLARMPAAVAAVAACLAPAPAAAGYVDLRFDHAAPESPAVTARYPGGKFTATPGPYYFTPTGGPLAGSFPAPTASFCVELSQGISPGQTYRYEVAEVGDEGNGGLYHRLWAAHYDTAWGEDGFKGSTASAAFQIASWELAYDGPDHGSMLGAFDGHFRASAKKPSAAAKLAHEWLLGLGTVDPEAFAIRFEDQRLVRLDNDRAQNQMTLMPAELSPAAVAPAPSSAALAVIGVGGGLLGRFRGRRAGV